MELKNIYDYRQVKLLNSTLEIYTWDFAKIIIEKFENSCDCEVVLMGEIIWNGSTDKDNNESYHACFNVLTNEIKSKIDRFNSFLDCLN